MTTAVQRRRGTNTEHASFTGLEGELSVNTTNESVHVHDGSTAGGFELARADASNIVATSIDINGGTIDGTSIGASSASTGAFTTLTASGAFTSLGIDDNADATAITIDSSENVGIGITSSLEKFTVANASSGIVGRFTNNTNQTLDLGVISGSGAAGGVYYNSANSGYHAFQVGGTERMRIDSSGNVGIGVANGDVTNDGNASRTYVGIIGSANRGRLNIGTTASNGADAATLAFTNGTNVLSEITVDTNSGVQNSGKMYINSTDFTSFGTAGSERMRIDSSGNLLVGTTSVSAGASSGKFVVGFAGNTANGIKVYDSYASAATNNAVVFIRGSSEVGSITTTTSATAYNTSSDQRLKDNIADADDAGSKIDSIKVRKYDWKADGSHQDYGMIAQELQAVAPEAVSGDADSEEMMGVDYSKLVPMLVKEIQSLRARVNALEAE